MATDLVDDDVRHGSEDASLSAHQRPQEDAVGAEGQQRSRWDAGLEPDLEADALTNLRTFQGKWLSQRHSYLEELIKAHPIPS